VRETRSWPGSTLQFSTNARKHIRAILSDFSIKTIYDAPCGDFHWTGLVIANSQVEYLGVDIVPDPIDYNRNRFQSERIKFAVSDIVVDAFPTTDLWICRDCLVHFSSKDILSTFEKFCESKIKLVLTTNHSNSNYNADIHTGQFGRLDLFPDSFNLSKDVAYRFPDYSEPNPLPREMVLWSREDILTALPLMRERIEKSSSELSDQAARLENGMS
jgi:hypothetical protein